MSIMGEKEPCFIGSQDHGEGEYLRQPGSGRARAGRGRVGIDTRLTVEEEGSVAADVDVAEATVRGELRGDVVASRAAVLHNTARVVGSIAPPAS